MQIEGGGESFAGDALEEVHDDGQRWGLGRRDEDFLGVGDGPDVGCVQEAGGQRRRDGAAVEGGSRSGGGGGSGHGRWWQRLVVEVSGRCSGGIYVM